MGKKVFFIYIYSLCQLIISLFFIRRYPKDTECMVKQLLKANPAVAEEYIDIINVDDDTTTSNENGDETHISKSESIINIARSTTTAREAVKRDPQFPNNNDDFIPFEDTDRFDKSDAFTIDKKNYDQHSVVGGCCLPTLPEIMVIVNAVREEQRLQQIANFNYVQPPTTLYKAPIIVSSSSSSRSSFRHARSAYDRSSLIII